MSALTLTEVFGFGGCVYIDMFPEQKGAKYTLIFLIYFKLRQTKQTKKNSPGKSESNVYI
jgi:hypothetical protein